MFIFLSTEYTEETDASQTSAIVLRSLLTIHNFYQGGIGQPPSARRFVTLRARANNVMRKLEVHIIFRLGFVCSSVSMRSTRGFHCSN